MIAPAPTRRTRRLATFGAAAAVAVPAVLGAGAPYGWAIGEPGPSPSAASTTSPSATPGGTATPADTATPSGGAAASAGATPGGSTSPTPGATPSASPGASGSPTPMQTPNANSIGGPRMAERGVIFGGGAPPPPETQGMSYVVADADTGQILAAKNPHGRSRPASTLKTLLALTMAPRLDRHSTYTTERDDTEVEGTRVGMVEHQTYPVDLLWYGLFLRSGNDAANAIAKAGAGGDLAKAVRMMNLEAQRLQALDTTAVNPSGLDADGQYSSAYDLALFGRAALGRGDLRRYMTKLKIVWPGDHTRTSTPKNSKPFDVYTGNRLLLHGYDGTIGVKNGYTTLAGNTFIAAAERDGRRILAVVMRGNATADSQALLDWGFENAASVVPVGELVDPVSPALVTVEDGAAANPGSAPAGPAGAPAEAGEDGAGSADGQGDRDGEGDGSDAAALAAPAHDGFPKPVAAAGAAGLAVVAGFAIALRRRRP